MSELRGNEQAEFDGSINQAASEAVGSHAVSAAFDDELVLSEADDIWEDEEPDQDKTGIVSFDIIQDYFRRIGQVKLLTAEQEVELSKQIEAGLYGAHLLSTTTDQNRIRDLELIVREGEAAKDHMLLANLRLVVSVAKRYAGKDMAFEELIQEGNLGLVRAVEKFDYTKGFKFSTYAVWWIRQSIARAVAYQARTIRLPLHVKESIVKMANRERALATELGRKPTDDELANDMDVSLEQLSELRGFSRDPLSLNQPVGDEGEAELADFIAGDDETDISDSVELQALRSDLHDAINSLPMAERHVLRAYFGLDGQPGMTYEAIGKMIGLSRTGTQLMRGRAVKNLRTGPFGSKLEAYLRDPTD